MGKSMLMGVVALVALVAVVVVIFTSSSETQVVSAVGQTCTTNADCAATINSFECRTDGTQITKQYHLEEYCQKPKKSNTGTCQYKLLFTREIDCAQAGTTCDPDTGFCADKHLACVKKTCNVVDGTGPHTCSHSSEC